MKELQVTVVLVLFKDVSLHFLKVKPCSRTQRVAHQRDRLRRIHGRVTSLQTSPFQHT